MIKSKFIAPWVLVVTMASTLVADEQRVVVGERALDQDLVARVEQERMVERSPEMETKEASERFVWASYSEHWAVGIDRVGGYIELEDGSYWSVRPSHTAGLNEWYANIDRMFITQNPTRWFSGYQYRIVNVETWTYVDANLILSPDLYSPYTIQVNAITYSGSHMTLTDGTSWKVYGSDKEISNCWYPSDIIIIGRNNDAYTKSDYPYCLINVNVDQWVRAK